MAQDTDQDKLTNKWNQETPIDKDTTGQREISIAEEYRMLLEGRRVQSRRSQTQTVQEKQRQEQLEMMKQQERRQKEKLQLKKQKQKLEKMLSKNESEGDDSMLSGTLKTDQASLKNRRESKIKDKSKAKDACLKTQKSEKIQEASRPKSELPKLAGKKRKPLIADTLSQSSDNQKATRKLDFGKDAQLKPLKSEAFTKENDRFGISLSKQHLFAEPNLNIAVDSDEKSESSYEEIGNHSQMESENRICQSRSIGCRHTVELAGKIAPDQKEDAKKRCETDMTMTRYAEQENWQRQPDTRNLQTRVGSISRNDAKIAGNKESRFQIGHQNSTVALASHSKVSGKLFLICKQIHNDEQADEQLSENRNYQSPTDGHSVSPSKQKGVKDFQEQLRDFTLLDKIMPDIKQTKGCFVQVSIGDQNVIGQVASVCEDSQNVLVRMKSTQIEEQFNSRFLRFLTRAYTCLLDDIDLKQMPQELAQIIRKDHQSSIVLIQVVYAMHTDLNSTEDPEVKNLAKIVSGNSVHRLNALVPNGENDFRLYPVTFLQGSKKQTQKKELLCAPIKEEDAIAERESLCYRNPQIAKQVLQHARAIQQAWKDNYLERTERVDVTADNIQELLFTICNFSERSERYEREQEREKEQGQIVPSFRAAKIKVGILLTYRIDEHDGERTVWAFLKLFPFKVNQKERVEWVRLDKVQIISNESLGFVQLASLGTQDTHIVNNSQTELKLRQLKMISKAESQFERAVNLQQKLSNIHTCQDKAMIAAEAPFFFSQKSKAETCRICKYQTGLDGVKFFNCSKCAENFHYKCLEEHQRNLGISEKHWRCPDCIRCNCCYSQKHKEQMLVCKNCNTSTHYECLPTTYRNRLKAFPTSESVEPALNQNPMTVPQTMIPSDFICECCIQCQNCLRHDAGEKKQNKWSKDFKFCSSCNKKRDRKEYCSICEQFWPNELEQREFMMKCGLCQTWVHLDCDRMLVDKSIRERFVGSDDYTEISCNNQSKAILASLKHSTLIYSCPSCRKIGRCNFLDQVLGIMINEDKRKDFVEPFWEKIHNSEYLTIIKKPICFNTIKHDIRASKKYLMHPESFKSDIMRIFWNARTFNPMQSEIHKAALRLNEKCSQILSQGRLWEIIETNAKASIDEERYSIFMRRKAKLAINQKTAAKAFNSSQTPEQLFDNQSSYHLKAKELFQLQEQINVRQFGVNIADLERVLQSQIDEEIQEQEKSGCFCHTLSCLVEPQVLFGLLEEANRRLISQNLNKRFDFAELGSRIGGKQLYDQEMYTNLSLIGQSSISSQANFTKMLMPNQKSTVPAQKDQWLQLIEELKNNEDRDGDWYSNPLKISFKDPSLIFAEMCYLCGSFGNQEDFLSCNLCGESFHPYCLPEPKEDPARFQDYWRCYNCIFCEKCHSSKQWEGLLICAVCDKVDHYWCLEPQLIQVPECNWKCPDCFKCIKCNTRQFFSEADIQNRVNLDPNEKFVHSYDFEFCYQCGIEEYRKTFCNLCGEKSGIGQEILNQDTDQQDATKPVKFSPSKKVRATPEADCHSQLIFKCTVCAFYSHLECSKTTVATLEEVVNRLGSSSIAEVYKCLDCLLMDKMPNFYFFQQCELYESIHQSLRRQSMVRVLLTDILAKYFTNQENVSATMQADLYVNMFIEQNQEWLRQETLVNQWLMLLESDLDVIKNEPDSDSTLTNQVPQLSSEQDLYMKSERPETSWSDFDMREVVETNTLSVQSKVRREIYGHKETLLPTSRNLYLHLYFPDLTRFGQDRHFITVNELAQQITPDLEAKLQKSDLAELFVNVEFRAVLKIRQRYCKWFEQLVTQTLKQAKLFVPDEEPSEEPFVRQTSQESHNAEPEQICTTSIKPNLRERLPITQRREMPEVEMKPATEMSMAENTMVDNPSKVLKCVLCHQYGERKISGRLIPFKANKFVHVNCAMWTNGIQEGHEEGILCTEIYNFHFAYRAYEQRICCYCQQQGASLICNSKKCNTAYHFPCAYASRRVQLRESSTFCETCTPKQADNQPGLPLEFLNSHKKRVVIVKNILPQVTDAFDDQVKNKPRLQQQASVLTVPSDLVKKEGNEQAAEDDQTGKKDNDVFVQCNNWSPYYYDMFNRVGNLTVLSLSRRRNAVIENLHAYKSKITTWADRLSRKISDKDLPDYAAVRIYWKYSDLAAYEKARSLAQDDAYLKLISGPSDQKGFYLFHDGDQVTEVTSVASIQPFYNLRLKEGLKVQTGSDHFVTLKANDFWEQQIQNLRRRYSKFCQENTYLTVQSIQGLDKFPIQYWNNPGEKINLDLRDPKIAAFFFKPSIKPDKLKKGQISPIRAFVSTNIDKKTSSLDSIFTQMLAANQVGADSVICPGLCGSDEHQEQSTKQMNYEQIMARLGKKTLKVKIQERREKEKAELAAENVSSAQGNEKTESDQQLVGFVQDQSENASDYSKAEVSVKGKDGSLRRKGGAKTDASDMGKGNDINQAMKYRAAKLNPKHVEVWISKIHRNGLFACQPLAPKDIVIEYVGEKIRESVANQREKYYEKLGVGDCYLFALDKDYIIDATFFGSKARYINHSCDPNLVSEKITVNGEKHIIFVANRHIAADEELTFDYQFDPENENNKLECFCGSAKCRSRLN